MRSLLPLVLLALLLWPVAANACDQPSLTCGSEMTASLDPTCAFDGTGALYVGRKIRLVSGTVLKVTATSGAFPPEIRFFYGLRTPILGVPNTTSSTLTATLDVQRSGTYIIATSAGDGSRSGEFFLSVACDVVCMKPFFFEKAPRQQTVSAGTRVQLFAPVDGTPLLHYRWFDVAKPSVTLSTEERYVTAPLASNVTYGVTVSNACGEVTGSVVEFTVGPCAAPSVSDPADQRVRLGETARFSVETRGSPLILLQWYEGESGDTSRPVAGATSSTLEIAGAAGASYWARASNPCGSADSRAAKLVVETRRRAARH